MRMILKNCKIITLLLGFLALTVGCAKAKKMGLANPASQNCVAKGGVVELMKRGDGGEYGICVFIDNRQCEEWALFRGECPVGGVKITGFSTPEGIYCAIKGGMVLENETQCQLPSGEMRSSQNLYWGKREEDGK